ncbi:hypothetical protein CMI37_02820 [Candidatus Pacearchaeota archaeon]|nr:hypothetical protein [Candidatus Pacearchaeota archaeon]
MAKKNKTEGIVDIHGKEYKTVAYRTNEVRAEYTIKDGWGIETEMLSNDSERVIMKAMLVDPNGKIVGSGHAEEYRSASRINKTSALENAETSAIGRALAAAGYAGTEFASADELVNALEQQKVHDAKQMFDATEVVEGKEWHHEKVANDFRGWEKLATNSRNDAPECVHMTYAEAIQHPKATGILKWAAGSAFEANKSTEVFKARAIAITTQSALLEPEESEESEAGWVTDGLPF